MDNLRSCPADLTVTVGGGVGSGDEGEEEQVFAYPKAVLANASAYIDTMLSVPMQEQEACAISFPEIQPKQWLKWTNYVFDPVGANKMNVCDNDTVEMLLFYDKYEFHSGIRLLDYKLSENIRMIIQDATLRRRQPTATNKLLEVVAAFIDGAIDFPLTKKVLPAFALGLLYSEKNIEDLFFFVNPTQELQVRLLLPYVFDATNIDLGPVIPDIVDIAYGATIDERSREELKSIVLEDSFLSTLQIKLSQTEQLTDVLSNLKIRHFEIDNPGTAEIAGRYKRHKRKDYGLGVMNCWYSMPNMVFGTGLNGAVTFVVQALDGIGSRWTLSAHLRSWEYRCGSTAHKSTLLYEWHKGENITSILPPKKGWIDMGAKDFFQREDNSIESMIRNYSADLVHLSYDINVK